MSIMRKIDLRINDSLLNLIDEYGKAFNMDRSKAVREILKRGLIQPTSIKRINKFLEEQETLMMKAVKEKKHVGLDILLRTFERDGYRCRKCGTNDSIMEIELPFELHDTTIAGLGCESKITLCKRCAHQLDRYIIKKHAVEDFVEWFYITSQLV